jgi:predicted flavoprotein YhiN
MSVSGVSGSGSGLGVYGGGGSASGKDEDPMQWFLSYMKKPTLERMQEQWLESHHITKEKLAKMTDAEKKALADQMQQDIKRQMQEAEAKKKGRVDLYA